MTRWVLPEPPKGPDYNFQPVVKSSSVVPFGYEEREDEPGIWYPVEEELIALEKAKKLRREYSLRVVADWLTKVTGRAISHQGLKVRLESESKRKRQAKVSEYWAKKYKEKMEEAQRIEAKLGGTAITKD